MLLIANFDIAAKANMILNLFLYFECLILIENNKLVNYMEINRPYNNVQFFDKID